MLRSKPLLRTLDTRARLSVPVDECDVCGKGFIKRTTLHTVCSPKCLLKKEREKEKAQSLKAKEERKKDRARKEKLKTRSDYIKEAQAAVNRYCRLRDFARGYGCVTCGVKLDMTKNADAGHWLGRGAYPEKRFNTFNIALQCVHDNQYLGGLPLKFRSALIDRYGPELVEKIEAHQPAQKWSIDYLKRLKRTYAKKARRMERKIDAMQDP